MLLTPKSNASGEGTSYNVKNGEKFAHVKLKLYLCIVIRKNDTLTGTGTGTEFQRPRKEVPERSKTN